MTEPTAPSLSPPAIIWLEGWKTCIQTVLSQTTGKALVFETISEPLAKLDSDLWFTVVVAGVVRGEMALRLPAVTAIRLAQKFLLDVEPPPEAPTAEHKEALEELLRQIAGQAATLLASVAGGELQLHLANSEPPSWSPSSLQNLLAKEDSGDGISLEIQISAALAAAFPIHPEKPVLTPAPGQLPGTDETPRYDRLRDVMLEVKLRFGSRRMLLREVLALSAGVVVELDNNVSSPVDLLLDGRVVAQGDVVVVDGKYGLRVTQVLESESSS
jgi:flagellar motor switch protein FliN